MYKLTDVNEELVTVEEALEMVDDNILLLDVSVKYSVLPDTDDVFILTKIPGDDWIWAGIDKNTTWSHYSSPEKALRELDYSLESHEYDVYIFKSKNELGDYLANTK